MYQTVKPINVAHPEFNGIHNGQVFQSKCLTAVNSYLIFNGMLYMEPQSLGSSPDDRIAVPVLLSDTISIYTTTWINEVQYWIEYDLVFEEGVLSEVVRSRHDIIKDDRDLSKLRPVGEDPVVKMTISVNGSSNEKLSQLSKTFENGDIFGQLRALVGEPMMTITYPVKIERRPYPYAVGLSGYSQASNIAQRSPKTSGHSDEHDIAREQTLNKVSDSTPIYVLDEYSSGFDLK